MVLGVTGPLCAGKSEAVAFLRRKGWQVVDVDKVGHAVLRRPEVAERLARRFGPGILDGRGKVDRRRLAELVFRDGRALADLERVVHPLMVAEIRDRLRAKDGDVVLEAAVLHRMGLDRLCDAVVVVTAPRSVLLERARRRGLEDGMARRILGLQRFPSEVLRSAEAVVRNDRDVTWFRRALAAAVEALRAGV